ncbi:two-component system response regulator [Betaproteobacteria bacterium]|nr:two-component system response regulator [Betaproteobacteria bacterium]GHT97718.1 two-component system response regulator [Betaproteobacteria bacterium]GHU28793.1 two-component system response regulator [Betaproteobacteria bacterium]
MSIEGYTDKPTILVVDDAPDNLALVSALLKDTYKVKVATNGEKALQIAASSAQPDLILLDIVMPGMDGYEVCKRLKMSRETHNIPVIFLTANVDATNEERGLQLGAVDYLTKPVVSSIVLARVDTHLKLKASADFLRNKTEFLEAEVAKRTFEVQAIQDVTIMAMASLAETRDNETGNHIRRTQYYIRILAQALQQHPGFTQALTDNTIKLLYKSAPLHDIGKVGIPDNILLKPGRLTVEEFEIMKTHTTLGRDAINHAEKQLGMKVDFLACAKEIAYSHHEKWDGSGYPQGLRGASIPVSARLMALADVYDALVSCRVYKPKMTHEQAREIILNGRGNHFDPDVVDAFLAIESQFLEIAARYVDGDSEEGAAD